MSDSDLSPELPQDVHDRITDLCADGDESAATRQFADAIASYSSAWDLLPEPKSEWEASTWILAAIGDANFLSGDHVAGRDNLTTAMKCPGAIGNPFIHVRLGQSQFELGDLDRAADNLARAFLIDGRRVFSDADPKYLALVKSRLKEPDGGWPEGY